MRSCINKKAVGLLFIMAFMLFPFRIFCEEEIYHSDLVLSIHQPDSHNDCPFCSINFCHEFENAESIVLDVSSYKAKKEVKSATSQAISIYLLNGNKSPPSNF